MQTKSKRGGANRNQGRKTIDPGGEVMRHRSFKATNAEWAKCLQLGGSAWIRAKIRAAKYINGR